MKLKIYSLVCVALILFSAAISWAWYQSIREPSFVIPQSFSELAFLSDEQLEQVDLARMNLLCAQGLPGSDELNIEESLQQLDRWAEHVKAMEQRYMPAFYPNLAKYRNSLALFKGAYLGIAIEHDFNCTYNAELADSGAMDDRGSTRFFRNSSDIFICGLVNDGLGSCSSLPVLMVALGRRCGYPLHLVGCGGHLFCRWDDGTECVNLEITCDGVNTHDDQHYMHWPRVITEEEIAEERYLKNYTSREMLGVFASLRGACLKEHGQYNEALACYEVALKSFPDSRIYRLCIDDLNRRLEQSGAGL